jgi:hypothetical protein
MASLLRDNWQKGQKLAHTWVNRVAYMLNHFMPGSVSVWTQMTPNGLIVGLSDDAESACAGKCKVNSDDDYDYLYSQFDDSGTYASGADALVKVQVVNNSGDRQLRVFLDVSAISGYNGAKAQALVNDNGTLKWVDVATC